VSGYNVPDQSQSSPTPNQAAGWGGLGGSVIGGLAGLFAAASNENAGPLSTGVWTIIGGSVVGVLTAASAFLVSYFNNATKLQKEIGELRDQVGKLRDELHTTLLREKDLKYDLERAQRRIDALETTAGVAHPPAIFGVVIADFTGTIQEFSPSLTPILGYLPEQMRGKNIEELVPSEYLTLYREKFQHAIKAGVTLDPTKKINTYALDKDSRKVPVSIALRKWTGETQLITATITLRPSALAGTDNNSPRRRSTDT
jgi:PAS domain S-box-containing protein